MRLKLPVWDFCIDLLLNSLVSAIGTCIGVGIIKNFVEFQKLEVVAILWLVGTALCDVLITAALTFHLVSVLSIGIKPISHPSHSANIEPASLRLTQSLTRSFVVSTLFRCDLSHY